MGDGIFDMRRTADAEKDVMLQQLESRDMSMARLATHASQGMEATITEARDVVTAVKGHKQCGIMSRSEFELTFFLELTRLSSTGGSVIHICFANDFKTAIPHIYIGKGNSKLYATVCIDGHTTTIDGPTIPVQRAVRVCFELRTKTCTLSTESFSTSVDLHKTLIPRGIDLEVYISSPTMTAAECTVFGVMCTTIISGGPVSSDMFMELPPAEKNLLAQAREEIQRNKEWAVFDSFFGLFVIANCLVIGVELEVVGYQETPEQERFGVIFSVVDNAFTVLFCIELFLRLWRTIYSARKTETVAPSRGSGVNSEVKPGVEKKSGLLSGRKKFDAVLWALLTNPWTTFDAVILAISLLRWTIQSFEFNTSFVRILRLLRLIKMVRLVRAFRELGILVEGVVSSLQTLFWTFILLLITTFAGTVVCIWLSESLSNDVGHLTADEVVKYFGPFNVQSGTGSVPWAMLRLFAMSTFDDWAAPIRLALRVGNGYGYLLALSFLVATMGIGMGILNIALGIMSFTTFVLDAKLRRMQTAEDLDSKVLVVKQFRTKLKLYGERPLFKNQHFISIDELIEAATKNEPIRSDLSRLGISTQEITLLAKEFHNGGDLEIDGIVEAVGSIVLQRYFSAVSTDFFGRPSGGALRPSDMLFFSFGASQARGFVDDTKANANVLCSLAYDIMSDLHSRSYKAYTVLKPKTCRSFDRSRKPKPLCSFSVSDVAKLGLQSNTLLAETSLFASLDLVFGVVSILNGIHIGHSTTSGKQNHVYFKLMDVVFATAFVVEFALRLSLFVNIKMIQHQTQVDDRNEVLDEDGGSGELITVEMLDKVVDLRNKMSFKGLVAPIPTGGVKTIIWWVPMYVTKDYANMLDAGIVFVCILDVLITGFFDFFSGVTEPNLSVITIFKFFRLFRMVRLLRTFHLLPQLQMLILALTQSLRSVVAILVLIIMLLYAFGLVTTVHIGFQTPRDSKLQKMFKDIASSMLTGWQFITFDDWGSIIQETFDAEFYGTGICLLFLMFLSGFGIIKMAIGILCGSAVTLGRAREQEARRHELFSFFAAMGDLQDLADEVLGTRVIAQEIFEASMSIKMRPRLVSISNSRIISEDQVAESLRIGRTSTFKVALFRIFERARLTASEVKQVFEKADFERTGFITVENFVTSAHVLKEDLGKVDIFANNFALTNLRNAISETNKRICDCFEAAQNLIEDVNALIQRKPTAKREVITDQDLRVLRATTQDALSQLAMTSGGEGLHGMGRSKITRGPGKIYFASNSFCFGLDTNFLSSNIVSIGDVFVWENNRKKGDATTAAVVTSILSENKLIISKCDASVSEPVPYLIIQTRHADEYANSTHLGTEASSQMSLPPNMSPRCAQQFLEWGIQTREVEIATLFTLERECDVFSQEVANCDEDLEELNNRSLAIDAWYGLKKNWVTWKESGTPPWDRRHGLEPEAYIQKFGKQWV
eukprot:TRINITY_DN5169_c0_g4_i1.p1 TRINITY_DN5169_c0_g4~~TRINITY_DN5169_c0_g4_i1.p1  ORF type:complete len:1455 (+),score=194.87 TRINITY_DN5169_c0_g4_i1:114-4478(+)